MGFDPHHFDLHYFDPNHTGVNVNDPNLSGLPLPLITDAWHLPVLSPDQCREIIEAAEAQGHWLDKDNADTLADYPFAASGFHMPLEDAAEIIRERNVLDCPAESVSGLLEAWQEFCAAHIIPLMERLYPGANLRLNACFVRKYQSDHTPNVEPHADAQWCALAIPLSAPEDYKPNNTGTFFPMIQKINPDVQGHGVFFRGLQSVHGNDMDYDRACDMFPHLVHASVPVEEGVRYTLISFFEDADATYGDEPVVEPESPYNDLATLYDAPMLCPQGHGIYDPHDWFGQLPHSMNFEAVFDKNGEVVAEADFGAGAFLGQAIFIEVDAPSDRLVEGTEDVFGRHRVPLNWPRSLRFPEAGTDGNVIVDRLGRVYAIDDIKQGEHLFVAYLCQDGRAETADYRG